MAKKPTSEQCVKAICKAIEDYCNSSGCPNAKSLSDVDAVVMIFFKSNGRARIHLIGTVLTGVIIEAGVMLGRMALQQIEDEANPLAS